ncbi:hypothetical protein TSUD_176580, partial [Trifolium subterraneum]
MDDGTTYQAEPQKPVWCERKQAVVQEEITRMNQLPANKNCISGEGAGVAFCRSVFVKELLMAM